MQARQTLQLQKKVKGWCLMLEGGEARLQFGGKIVDLLLQAISGAATNPDSMI